MAALGWLLNLDFAGGGDGVAPTTVVDSPNTMRNYRGMRPGAPMSIIQKGAVWITSLTPFL